MSDDRPVIPIGHKSDCPAEWDGWLCTLDAGHALPHAAHASDQWRPLLTWPPYPRPWEDVVTECPCESCSEDDEDDIIDGGCAECRGDDCDECGDIERPSPVILVILGRA